MSNEPVCSPCALVLSNHYRAEGGWLSFYPKSEVTECARCGDTLAYPDEVAWIPAVVMPMKGINTSHASYSPRKP